MQRETLKSTYFWELLLGYSWWREADLSHFSLFAGPHHFQSGSFENFGQLHILMGRRVPVCKYGAVWKEKNGAWKRNEDDSYVVCFLAVQAL